MLLFRSEEYIDRWCRAHDLLRSGTMTPQIGWQLAHAWYADKLKPQWRRKTPEEAATFFAKLGLRGPFWDLQGT
jgi:carboxypeptidase C (cathepsin A)